MSTSTEALHPLAPEHLPGFITPPGATDSMMITVSVVLLALILLLGVGYLTLHALPERMAHKRSSMQFQLIGVLALLALFTHNAVFWFLALILAVVQVPDFMAPLSSIARSLEKATGRDTAGDEASSAERTDHV